MQCRISVSGLCIVLVVYYDFVMYSWNCYGITAHIQNKFFLQIHDTIYYFDNGELYNIM